MFHGVDMLAMFFFVMEIVLCHHNMLFRFVSASQHHDQSGLSGTLPGTEDQVFVQLFVVSFEQIVVCDLHSLLGADDVYDTQEHFMQSGVQDYIENCLLLLCQY
jgi:hypothetical protein